MEENLKQLLFVDLCARLPYMVKCRQFKLDSQICNLTADLLDKVDNLEPYLRPISSMTLEEKEELLNLLFDKEAKHFYINGEGLIDGKTSSLMKEGLNYPAFCPINITLYTDWLNAHHFDYRGLIPMGLALEAPNEIYNN